jgi:6,7-dimethyl-8-ribityllumazine synthase
MIGRSMSKLIDSASPRIAFVQSCWHKELVDRCKEAFLDCLKQSTQATATVDLFEVPGAFEIPLYVQRLIKTGKYGAVVAAGLVVDGGIYRHEFVAQAVISGLMQVQLAAEVPVISAVLTPQSFHAHAEHEKFISEHLVLKGREAAHACINTIMRLSELNQSPHT